MNIGVIGTGNIGEVIISRLRDAGYPVKMANSRGPESLSCLLHQSDEGGTPAVAKEH